MGTFAFAQTQRTVLLEHFTQASCGPCATYNPAIEALINANPGKIIALKHQTSWPGVDPMNAQNPTQVATRVSYYSVTGVPNSVIDGNYYNGHPASVNQAMVDGAYAVPAPFSLSTSHTFSASHDSIFITVNVQAAQAFTTANVVKLRVNILERTITFASPPGSNGETSFSWVMRRMIPDDQGYTIASTWTNAQTQTYTFAVPVPWYIYNVNTLGVVAFIQDNTSKAVHQAAYSVPNSPVPTVNDAQVTALGGIATSCNTTVNPTVTLRNNGTATLTSANIHYGYDFPANWYTTDFMSSYAWSGSLATGGTTTVNLPSNTLSTGSHSLTVHALQPSTAVDLNPNNSYKRSTFYIFPSLGNVVPITEGYQAAVFPPTDWSINNPDGSFTWTRYGSAGGFGNSTASTKMDFYNSPPGQFDELYMPSSDLSLTTSSVTLAFNVAYAQYTTENDQLQVLVSTNCGTSWATVVSKAGTALMTAPATTASFVPTATQWRAESVNLDPYRGNNNVLIKFKAVSAYGNNLYIDDINLQYLTGINQPSSSSSVDVYPNPSNGVVNVNLNLNASQNVVINVYNSLGEIVSVKEIGSTNGGLYPLNLSGLASGNYTVQVLNGKNSTLHKITLNK